MTDKKFPGPIAEKLLKDNDAYYATTTVGSRICVAKRDGAIVEDYDGFKFIDFHCDASVNNLGGNQPALNYTLVDQTKTGNLFSEHHNAPNIAAVELAKRLVEKSPVPKPAKVYFGNSGAEANECAIKLCKAHRYVHGERFKRKAIYLTDAFHGRTLGILPGTNSKPAVQRDPFWNHCDKENSIYLPYPSKPSLTKSMQVTLNELKTTGLVETIDRLIIELPCQGEGGINPADEGSVKLLYDFAIQHEIFFIVDAIQCGMGRTGTLFGCDLWPWLKPDIITLGKALGGGIPIGATIFRRGLDFTENGMHSSTFGGGPLAANLGLVMLNEVESLIASTKLIYLAANLKRNLEALQNKYPAYIVGTRGIGAMWAHEIYNSGLRDFIIQKAEELAADEEFGLRLLSAGKSAIRFMPPLNITNGGDNLFETAFHLYEKVVSRI